MFSSSQENRCRVRIKFKVRNRQEMVMCWQQGNKSGGGKSWSEVQAEVGSKSEQQT